MTHTNTKPRTPWLAVLSVEELRRLFRQVQATGKVSAPPARRRRSVTGRRAA